MASVLKTEDLQGSGGSNPSPSAKGKGTPMIGGAFAFGGTENCADSMSGGKRRVQAVCRSGKLFERLF